MASRRQREFDRKYSSYRKYTATEDVNYSSHVTRSSYRSESITHRSGDRGRSSSSEIISGSETRSLPVYIAIQDYTPDEGHTESVALEQGQIVEVLDKKNAESWLIKTKARPSKTGWVPGSYFESPAEYYKQRRRTREIEGSDLNLSEEQQAILKRDQVYHDLLRSEEGFVAELGHVVDNYIKVLDTAELPEAVDKIRSELAMNVKELCNFHSHVMLKGLQYYSDDPGKVGQTFVRLERDLELHVQFHTQLPKVLELLQETPVQQFFQDLSNKVEAGAKSYEDYLKTIAERIVQYQNYFKEFIKYSARAKLSTKSMQRALELTQSVPQRAKDTDLIDSIENYPGDKLKLGKIFRHDLFLVWEGEQGPEERDVFLFKNKVMLTEYDNKSDPPKRKHTVTIRLDRYTVSTFPEHADTLVFKPNEPGLPDFRIRAKDIAQMEIVRQAWLKNIQEMKEQQSWCFICFY
uniref:SH3 domain-containing protein n=1 Tax=Syphacia muris TaxID=451379 RepID=A0A158R4E5_9BILA